MSNSNTPTDGQQAVLAPATLNSSSFKTRCILQNHAEEVTTPRVAEFSINGALVAIGHESGFLEIRETCGDWNPIRWFNTGARVTSVRWHPGFSKTLFVSSGNGNLHTIRLGDTLTGDTHDLLWFEEYISSIALSPSGSQLAVAFGTSVVLIDRPLSSRRTEPTLLPTSEHIRLHSPRRIHDFPLTVQYIDNHTLLVLYINYGLTFHTRSSHEGIAELSSEGDGWFGVSALSPNRQELTTSTLTSNNLNRYSMAQMRYTDSHEIHGTPNGNTVHRRFGVSYLNDTTVVSGHNHGFIGIVHDTGREDPDQYRTLYFKLSHSGRVTHTVTAGLVAGKPVILAINGEEQNSKIFIVDVKFTQPDCEERNKQVHTTQIHQTFLILAYITLIIFFIGLVDLRRQVQEFREVLTQTTVSAMPKAQGGLNLERV